MKITRQLKVELCKGHLGFNLNERCHYCKADEWNTSCEDYDPVHSFIYEIEGEKDEIVEYEVEG